MADRAEVLLAQAEQDRAVELRVAADVVVQAGVEALSVRGVPRLRRLVGAVHDDGLAVPVARAALDVVATLHEQDALPRLREAPRHRAAARPRSDDDDVVVLAGHDRPAPRHPKAAP